MPQGSYSSLCLYSPSIFLLAPVALNIIHMFMILKCLFADPINKFQKGATDNRPFHQGSQPWVHPPRLISCLLSQLLGMPKEAPEFHLLYLSYSNLHKALSSPVLSHSSTLSQFLKPFHCASLHLFSSLETWLFPEDTVSFAAFQIVAVFSPTALEILGT